MFNGDAWLAGNRVAGARFLFNHTVRISAGPDTGKLGWIVGIDVTNLNAPVYTIEMCDGSGDLHLPESSLESAD